MATKRIIEVKEPVRGELRVGDKVVPFEIEAGEVAADKLEPAVLAHLLEHRADVVSIKGGVTR